MGGGAAAGGVRTPSLRFALWTAVPQLWAGQKAGELHLFTALESPSLNLSPAHLALVGSTTPEAGCSCTTRSQLSGTAEDAAECRGESDPPPRRGVGVERGVDEDESACSEEALLLRGGAAAQSGAYSEFNQGVLRLAQRTPHARAHAACTRAHTA